MYCRRPESNEDTSVTEDKKGKNPTRVVSVEIEEALNAEHASEFLSDMQFWAIDVGILLASTKHAIVVPLTPLAFRRFGCRRVCGHCAAPYMADVLSSSTTASLAQSSVSSPSHPPPNILATSPPTMVAFASDVNHSQPESPENELSCTKRSAAATMSPK